MENKIALVARETEEMNTNESEVADVIVDKKETIRQDLKKGLKDFGIGCCEAGKTSLAPLASTMVKYFFNWVIDSFLK